MQKISLFEVKENIPDAWKNDITFKQTIAFLSLSQITNTLVNIQNGKLEPRDFEVRDLVFQKRFQFEEIPDIYDFIEDHYSVNNKTQDQNMYLQTLREKCQMRKYEFWKKYSKLLPTTQDRLETKSLINRSKYYQIFVTNAIFIGFAIGLSYLFKLQNNPLKYRVLFGGSALIMSYYFATFRNSNEIFNNIPPLPYKEAEQERQKILNYCFTMDIDLVSKYMLFDENIKKRFDEMS